MKDRTLPNDIYKDVTTNQNEELVPPTSDASERGGTHRNYALDIQPEPRPASTGKIKYFKSDPDGNSLRGTLGGGESGDCADRNDVPRECQKVGSSGQDQTQTRRILMKPDEDNEEEHRNRLNSMSSGQRRVGIDEDDASWVSGMDSIDEGQVLDKLLNENTPSAIFREDHNRLLQKLLKSQVRIQTPNAIRCCCLKGRVSVHQM